MTLAAHLRFPKVPLSNGLQIPILGLGTSHDGGFSHDAIVYALTECGVCHIDTAKRYGCEEKLGDYGYKAAKKACLDSCSQMRLHHFDLYLMHWPESLQSCNCSNREMRAETWRALEELYQEGVCRAIGVSNFQVQHLEELKEDCSVVPHVNQVEYHPFQQSNQLMGYCRREGIVFEGYSPLAKGQVLRNPTVLQIAEKYGHTPAQICIRWSIQNGVVTIPKSTKKKRIRENCQVFGFQLEESDMATLGSLHDGRHVTWDSTHVE
ncbi:hypothetical protein CesoFtcFv8_015034 [Champsocephalus esox]|uniref:NADP-dependent oxidoreductase domain-containing protein n=1 Tax=Champsocephalus esox TaxID=159716 RepID=A0AAN8BQ70_9TELE|nr:hypothetical protein CesoFtcFv8_015034 [Champsocephalus esox]